MRIFVVAVAVSCLSFPVEARHKHAKFAGEACPPESSDVVLSPDGETLSVLFGKFVAEAGGNTGKENVRVSCELSVPIDIPKGQRLAVYELDYRGYHLLPKQAKATLDVEYDFGKHKSPKFKKNFHGQKDEEFFLSDQFKVADRKWSACEDRTIDLSVRATLSLDAKNQKDLAIVSVDTVDGGQQQKGGLIYKLQFQPCR